MKKVCVAVAFAAALMGFASAGLAADDGVLMIKKQGVFSSGGAVTEPIPGEFNVAENWLDFSRAGNTAHVDHANTFYQIPDGETKSPIVYLHGYGQSRTGWQSTPDGREGWSDIFLRKGRAAFLVDQPRRGAAGSTVGIVNNEQDTRANGTEFKEAMNKMISVEDFDKVEVRVGTVTDVKENKKSRDPAYVLTIDFGAEIGVKKSSAQITSLYKPEDLLGTQVVCCVNLGPMHIGSVKSEVRVLGSDSEQGVVLLRLAEPVKNGDRIF